MDAYLSKGVLYAFISPLLLILWIAGLRNRCFMRLFYSSLIALGAGYAIKPMKIIELLISFISHVGFRAQIYMGVFIGLLLSS